MANTQQKPSCRLIGEDSNIFNLVGKVSKTLKRAGQPAQAKEMAERVCKSHSYSEALVIIGEFVEIS